jgi:hypothetical protein
MGTMAIPDHTGHREVRWTADDDASLAEAAAVFAELETARLVPFARTGLADFQQVRAFDPAADEILWVRPLQGG